MWEDKTARDAPLETTALPVKIPSLIATKAFAVNVGRVSSASGNSPGGSQSTTAREGPRTEVNSQRSSEWFLPHSDIGRDTILRHSFFGLFKARSPQ